MKTVLFTSHHYFNASSILNN